MVGWTEDMPLVRLGKVLFVHPTSKFLVWPMAITSFQLLRTFGRSKRVCISSCACVDKAYFAKNMSSCPQYDRRTICICIHEDGRESIS